MALDPDVVRRRAECRDATRARRDSKRNQQSPPDSRGALAGVRVLDIAGAPAMYCGKLLADMGADVIKIEPPGGARWRGVGPFYGGTPHRERSLFFWHYNTNKRSVTLDLDVQAGRERFLRLAETADIVIETGAPGHL